MKADIAALLLALRCVYLVAVPQICNMIMPGDLEDNFLMIIPDDLSIAGGIVSIPLIPKTIGIVPDLRPRVDMESQNETMVWGT
jgi:hypothetical protein